MKPCFTLSLSLILSLCSQTFAQHHEPWSGPSDVVFLDSTNVRATPSLKGKIIGRLPQNTIIERSRNNQYNCERDTISGVDDYWIAIKYRNKVGYIWQPILAQSSFNSEIGSHKNFLFTYNQPKKNIEFKVFGNKQFENHFSFNRKNYKTALAWNMGKTFNSNGKEIFVVKYYADTLCGFELFEWDGFSIQPSSIKLNDDSFITHKYLQFKNGIVNSNDVNLKEAPSSKSKSVAVVQKNERLEVIDDFVDYEQINDTVSGHWHSVKWNGKEVFIWSDHFDVPFKYIKSNVKENESFLLTNNAVYAFENNIIKARVRSYSSDDDDFFYDGNKGFPSNHEFLAICMEAHSCGETSGDNYILWKDEKLLPFLCDCSMGDGGYYEGGGLIFPNQTGGIKNRVIDYYESGEQDESASPEEGSAVSTKSTRIMELVNDSLIEAHSEHLTIKLYIAKNFPKYELRHYEFIKLNNDTTADVVFFLSSAYEENGEGKLKTLLGYAFADSLGNYLPAITSSQIVQDGFFAVQYKMEENLLKIKVKYNLGYDSEDEKNAYYHEYKYKYDKQLNAFLWNSVSYAKRAQTTEQERNFKWGDVKADYFKSKKIKFENTWNYFRDGFPGENSEE